jgi:hypothetical protein
MSESGRQFSMPNNSYEIDREAKRSISLSQIRQVFNDWVRKLRPSGQTVIDSQRGNQVLESGKPETANSDAEFLGWQKTKTGEAFALYNVTAQQHPLYRSTVSEKTLRQQRLEIPPTPLPQGQTKRFDHEE